MNPADFYNKLTQGARTALPFIRGNVAAGVGATKTYYMLREAGLGARKQDVLRLYKHLKSAYDDKDKYLPPDITAKPDSMFIPLTITTQMRAFGTNVGVTQFNELTGETTQSFITIADDFLQTQQETIELAEEVMQSYDPSMYLDAQLSYIENITYSDNPRFRG